MTPQLTDQERQEWESWKYSNKVASVLMLTSGRVVIARQGLEIVDVGGIPAHLHPTELENQEAIGACLYTTLMELREVPLDEYRPPSVRRIDPSLSPSDLKQVDDLLADMELRL